MDNQLGQFLCQIGDKLEDSLFGRENTSSTSHNRNFPLLIAFTESSHSNLVDHLQLQIFLGLLFNIYLSAILFFYLPFNVFTCWTCSPSMTIWLSLMGFTSTLMIIPKIILLIRLFQIEEALTSTSVNSSLWLLFHSKVFAFNKFLGRSMILEYFIGLGLFYGTETKQGCENVFGLIAFLLISFLATFFIGFSKLFSRMLEFSRHEETFKSLDVSFDGVEVLQVMNWEEYNAKYKARDDCCSVCYERYKNESILRIMKCQGSHVFHKDCIDQWLQRSGRCPECNLSVLEKSFFTRSEFSLV